MVEREVTTPVVVLEVPGDGVGSRRPCRRHRVSCAVEDQVAHLDGQRPGEAASGRRGGVRGSLPSTRYPAVGSPRPGQAVGRAPRAHPAADRLPAFAPGSYPPASRRTRTARVAASRRLIVVPRTVHRRPDSRTTFGPGRPGTVPPGTRAGTAAAPPSSPPSAAPPTSHRQNASRSSRRPHRLRRVVPIRQIRQYSSTSPNRERPARPTPSHRRVPQAADPTR